MAIKCPKRTRISQRRQNEDCCQAYSGRVLTVWPYVGVARGRQIIASGRIDSSFQFAWAVAILLRTAKENVSSDKSFQMIHDIITLFSPCTVTHFQRQCLFLFLSVIFIASVHLIFYDCLLVFNRSFQTCHCFYKNRSISRHFSKPVWNALLLQLSLFFTSDIFIEGMHCCNVK